jgi:pimeloyl-ACP methyl ester carboxylesterase
MAESAGFPWAYAIGRDGTPLFYESWGDRDDRAALALCDGIGCDGYVWRYLREDFARRPTVHAHYRGHGRTPAPSDRSRVRIIDLADDLASVLDDAGISRAVLVGHSMGVQVALETFRRHRDRVAGLVLMCGAPSHPLRTFRNSAALEELLPKIQRLTSRLPSVINRFTRMMLPTRLAYEIAARLEIQRDLVQPSDFMPYLEGMSRVDIRLFVAMLSSAGEHSAEDLLGDIDVPTLVISGERDGFTPPERSHAMAAAIPGADLLEIPGGSHTAPIERPELVSDRVREFLATRVDRVQSTDP